MNAPLPGPKAATRRFFTLLRETNKRLDAAAEELEQLRCVEAIARLVVEGWDSEGEPATDTDFPVAMDALRKALGMEAPS